MAAAFHLAKGGLRVLCIESEPENKDAVGESLDWSAPELLAALGLPMSRLLDEEIATYKRHVLLRLRSGAEERYKPSDWLARPPFNVELRTIHVDRAKLDGVLRETVTRAGVTQSVPFQAMPRACAPPAPKNNAQRAPEKATWKAVNCLVSQKTGAARP